MLRQFQGYVGRRLMNKCPFFNSLSNIPLIWSKQVSRMREPCNLTGSAEDSTGITANHSCHMLSHRFVHGCRFNWPKSFFPGPSSSSVKHVSSTTSHPTSSIATIPKHQKVRFHGVAGAGTTAGRQLGISLGQARVHTVSTILRIHYPMILTRRPLHYLMILCYIVAKSKMAIESHRCDGCISIVLPGFKARACIAKAEPNSARSVSCQLAGALQPAKRNT